MIYIYRYKIQFNVEDLTASATFPFILKGLKV